MSGRCCCYLHKGLLKESLNDVDDKMKVSYVSFYSEAVIEKYKAQLSDQSNYKVTDPLLISHSTRPFYKQDELSNDYRQVKRSKSC